MNAPEVVQLQAADPDLTPVTCQDIRALAVDIEHALNEVVGALHDIQGELVRWRNAGGTAEIAGIPHSTVTHLDEYGRAPIVQILTESVATKFRMPDGRELDLIAYAVDSNGDTWPMVRSEKRPRPTVVRDADEWEDL